MNIREWIEEERARVRDIWYEACKVGSADDPSPTHEISGQLTVLNSLKRALDAGEVDFPCGWCDGTDEPIDGPDWFSLETPLAPFITDRELSSKEITTLYRAGRRALYGRWRCLWFDICSPWRKIASWLKGRNKRTWEFTEDGDFILYDDGLIVPKSECEYDGSPDAPVSVYVSPQEGTTWEKEKED